jgi:hypothetical protein
MPKQGSQTGREIHHKCMQADLDLVQVIVLERLRSGRREYLKHVRETSLEDL